MLGDGWRSYTGLVREGYHRTVGTRFSKYGPIAQFMGFQWVQGLSHDLRSMKNLVSAPYSDVRSDRNILIGISVAVKTGTLQYMYSPARAASL